MKIPASPRLHQTHRDRLLESGGRDWTKEFAAMGLDFETEWKNALKENLVLMRNGEAEMKKVDELAKRPPRSGLRHNATNVG